MATRWQSNTSGVHLGEIRLDGVLRTGDALLQTDARLDLVAITDRLPRPRLP